MGIPIGLLLGWPIGRLLLSAIVNMLTDDIRIVTTVNPLIFLVAIVFSAITVFISCQKPAILAAKVSPMEALHYIEQTGGKKKQRRSKHISTMMMAKNNLTRNKKKVMIVTLSFALSIVLLNSVYTYVTSFDFDKFVADFSLTDFTVSDTTVINNYAPYNTANVSQDFISQAESLNGLEDIGNIYLWTSKQPLSENDLARLQELSACSSDIANELENYRIRQEHGVNVYGLDDFPAEYVQVLDGELNTEQWKAGTGVYVTPLRMMGDGSLCLYKPGDQISVTQLDGTNKVYDVLAVVSIPSALQTPLQVDMGLDYIFPTNELLGNMVSADQPAMKTIFNVDEEHQLATENWLKNYTTNTDTALDYLSKVTLRQTFDGMINMYRLVGGALCAILALIGILNFINSMTTSILSRYACRELIVTAYGEFANGKVYGDKNGIYCESKVFESVEFGYNKIVVERPQRDEAGNILLKRGKPVPDTSLRDTENVPLVQDIDAYFAREVLPYAPDAWIDHSKTKVGYEIPMTRYFYEYQAPEAVEDIVARITALEQDISAGLVALFHKEG